MGNAKNYWPILGNLAILANTKYWPIILTVGLFKSPLAKLKKKIDGNVGEQNIITKKRIKK